MQQETVKTRLKVGDEVMVIAGRARTQRGEILAINKNKGLVWIKGVNLRKRYVRPSQEMPKGGQVEIESPVRLSNVMFYDSKSKKVSRLGIVVNKNGKKVRVAKASGRELE